MGTDVVKNVNKNNASHAVLFEALALVSLSLANRSYYGPEVYGYYIGYILFQYYVSMKFYCSDKFSHQYWQWNSYLIGNYALNMLMNVKACNI